MNTHRPRFPPLAFFFALVPAFAAGCSLGADSAGEMGNDRLGAQAIAESHVTP